MRRPQVALLALLGVLAAIVAVFALRNPQAPFLPHDAEHRSWTGTERCITCHGKEGVLPRSKNHPLGNDCLDCHGRR